MPDQRRDDILTIARGLRIGPGYHSPTCATVPWDEGGRTHYPIGATCDCGRHALDRLANNDYPEEERDA